MTVKSSLDKQQGVPRQIQVEYHLRQELRATASFLGKRQKGSELTIDTSYRLPTLEACPNPSGFNVKRRFNQVTDVSWVVTYDAQNRLVKIQSGSTVIHYHYDPLNRIVARRAPDGAITTQVWDDWKLIEEREANDAFRRMYFHGAATNEIVAACGPAYGDAFYFQDGRGNVTHLTGPWNNVIERYTYYVSGQPNYLSGNTMDNRFLFQGAMFVPEAEIYDMRNRFYHPNLGRFMQSDPTGLHTEGAKLTAEQKAFYSPGGVAPEAFASTELNLYRYCHNDPVNHTDPMGLETLTRPEIDAQVGDRVVEYAQFIGRQLAEIYREEGLIGIIGMASGGRSPRLHIPGRLKLPAEKISGPPKAPGNAPVGKDGHPVEIHHEGGKAKGPFREMTRSDHRLGDNYKKNHPDNKPSEIDRKAFDQQRKEYWKEELKKDRFR